MRVVRREKRTTTTTTTTTKESSMPDKRSASWKHNTQRGSEFRVRVTYMDLFLKSLKLERKTELKILLCDKLLAISHLKKSFLQNNLPSREKHLSVRGAWQSKHRTQSACHVLSRTFSRNLSRMGLSQPAHAISIPAAGSHRPKTIRDNNIRNQNQKKIVKKDGKLLGSCYVNAS